uniref:Uncharacterized protein n=1 Tax=Ditylenchus dipsaci TaxID=166011 RepID=A0A915E5L2_9BILA
MKTTVFWFIRSLRLPSNFPRQLSFDESWLLVATEELSFIIVRQRKLFLFLTTPAKDNSPRRGLLRKIIPCEFAEESGGKEISLPSSPLLLTERGRSRR